MASVPCYHTLVAGRDCWTHGFAAGSHCQRQSAGYIGRRQPEDAPPRRSPLPLDGLRGEPAARRSERWKGRYLASGLRFSHWAGHVCALLAMHTDEGAGVVSGGEFSEVPAMALDTTRLIRPLPRSNRFQSVTRLP